VEQALLNRARVGDREAFARLVGLHREAVYRAAYWILKDPEEALDATQEAFLRAFRHIDRFDGRSSFRTWARRIATNTALDRYARRKRDRERNQAMGEDQVVADPRSEGVDAGLLREERKRLVREAIEGLPPAQRAAVVLRDVEGLSYAEIGEALGIPKGTVMSRIYYGRTNLKERLSAFFGVRADEIRAARGGGTQ
jgi:RNA polymerase sigma-70 factor (ECF subfamily)